VKRLFAVLTLAASTVVVHAQQPQTQTAPIYRANAKYVQGVGPGYWPTAGSGLTLNVAAGTAFCSGNVITYAGGTLTMTASATNYVYLITSSSCVPAVKTTAFTASDIPIATVVAGSSAITSIADVRTFFQQGAVSGGSSVSVDGNAVSNPNLDSTTPAPDSGYTLGRWKISGSNISVEVPSSSSGVGSMLAGANVVFTGESMMLDDSGNTLGAQTTATAASCTSTGLCTVTAPNAYQAGQWVDFNPYGFSPSCISAVRNSSYASLGYYGTGTELYQVLAGGLNSTQFEVQTTCTATTGTGGTIEDATYFLPVETASSPAFKNVNAWYLRNPVDMTGYYGGINGLICENAVNFTAIYGNLLPSVTGKPLYILMEGGVNDVVAGATASTLEGCLQSFWSAAHAAGAYVVQNQIILDSGTPSAVPNIVNMWLRTQGKTTSNAVTGQYWDYPGVAMSVYGTVGIPPPATVIAQISQVWDAALESPGTSEFIFNSSPLDDGAGTSLYDSVGNAQVIATYSTNLGNFFLMTAAEYFHTSSPGLYLAGTAAVFGWDDPNGSNLWGPDTAFSRQSAGLIRVGNGNQGDYSASLEYTNLTLHGQLFGLATAPTGFCTVVGWEFTQDGRVSYCNGATWSQPFGAGTSGTSGGIPYYPSTSTMASSALLTHYGLVYGGGAGGAPVSMAACAAGMPVVGSATVPVCSTISHPSSATSGYIVTATSSTVLSAATAAVSTAQSIATSSTLSSTDAVASAITATAGGIQGKSLSGTTAATVAAGAAAGSSPTIACTTSHVCSPVNGTITLSTGTSMTTGALLTITNTLTHTNYPDCLAHIILTASPYTEMSGYSFSYSTTVWTLNVGTALTASTSYTITYSCLGY
jgi:hypothetical protein